MSVDVYNDISHIYKFIHISNYNTSKDIRLLKKLNIDAVLYIGASPKSTTTLQTYDDHGITHKFIYMTDTIDTDIQEGCDKACDFINKITKQKKNILIHCRKGVSRSPTVVAYYLMKLLYTQKDKMYPVLDDILSLIHIYRPCSRPNVNFIKQLKIHEKKIAQV